MTVPFKQPDAGARGQQIGVENDFGIGREPARLGGDFVREAARHDDDHAGLGLCQSFGTGKRAAVALADMGFEMRVDQQP